MYSKKRSRNVARPRQVAMALAKELTQLSLPDIGDAFGGRDHTTVLHACRKIALLKSTNSEHHARLQFTAQGPEKLMTGARFVDSPRVRPRLAILSTNAPQAFRRFPHSLSTAGIRSPAWTCGVLHTVRSTPITTTTSLLSNITMKLVQTRTRRLLKPLQAVTGIVEKRHTLPILSNVLHRAQAGTACTLVATDLEIQVSTQQRAREGRRGRHEPHGVGAQAPGHPARAAGRQRRSRSRRRTTACRCARARAASTCRRCRRRIFRAMAEPGAAQAKVTHAAEGAARAAAAGAVRDGAAGHPLLPERPAAGARRAAR